MNDYNFITPQSVRTTQDQITANSNNARDSYKSILASVGRSDVTRDGQYYRSTLLNGGNGGASLTQSNPAMNAEAKRYISAFNSAYPLKNVPGNFSSLRDVIDSVLSVYTGGNYQDYADSLNTNYSTDLSDQYDKASQQAKYKLAATGNAGAFPQIKRKLNIANDKASGSVQNTVADTISNLMSRDTLTLNSINNRVSNQIPSVNSGGSHGLNKTALVNEATTSRNANRASSVAPELGDLFSKFLSDLPLNSRKTGVARGGAGAVLNAAALPSGSGLVEDTSIDALNTVFSGGQNKQFKGR